jgi:N-acetyl-gamma-glutamyl-phosphate reductase
MYLQMKKIKAGIIGGAGYTGGEMLRVLLQHPNVDIRFVHSRSNAGVPVCQVHTDVLGETDLFFSSSIEDVDVLFLCVGHGEAKTFLEQNKIRAVWVSATLCTVCRKLIRNKS